MSEHTPHPARFARHPLPVGEGSSTERARELRQHMTDAERKLWFALRDRRLDGFKFRRQHPIGRFVVDFYCEEAKLVVELDGGQHATDVARDQRRTAYLGSKGCSVMRFWNNDALSNIEGVLQAIRGALPAAAPRPRHAKDLVPSPTGRGLG